MGGDGDARVNAVRTDDAAHQRALARIVMASRRVRASGSGLRQPRSASWPACTAIRQMRCSTWATAKIAHDEPLADASAACDAAFYLDMREAYDFGGGGRRNPAA